MMRLAAPGGDAMAGYRLYFMDRFSGHIDNRREFVAESDAAALEIAERWHDGGPMELWLGDRKLKHWDATPMAPSTETTSAGE
jgi:hypothetical protein